MDARLEKDITYLKGVGPKKAQLFKKLGIENVFDLLQYCPRDYIDLTCSTPLKRIAPGGGEPEAVKAVLVRKLPVARVRKGMVICKAVFTDGEEDVTAVFFNGEYAFSALKEGGHYLLYGKVTGNMVRKEMSSPMIFPADSPDLIMPVYPLTEGINQKFLRREVKTALELLHGEVNEVLPSYITQRLKMPSVLFAWENVHFPQSLKAAVTARKRLIFDELLIYSLAMGYRRKNLTEKTRYSMKLYSMKKFIDVLPFSLTDSQKSAIDMSVKSMVNSDCRVNRLIQGDVGSGKTVVAAALAYFTYLNGWQSCMMAPTEILAAQHYETFKEYLEPLGVKVCLLSGGMKPKQKKEIQQALADGEYDAAVGTHALFYGNTSFKNLALVITDEQHRFGVEQRKKLSEKGDNPHVITMSATPIPRTLALMLYGDLEVSALNELPAGRTPVKTYAVSGKMRKRAYGFIKQQLDAGHQGFIVCPAVEEGEQNIKNAVDCYEELKAGEFAGYRLGLLHGKMPSEQKDSVMESFKRGEIDLLVATTVVEVGVDVPNATVMMVENADRFGLSQLHQLRGRVGRGRAESFCILVTDNTSEDCIKRLKAISSTNDGFKVAEEDLKLRGPGDFFGTMQHGLPSFKIADLTRDTKLLEAAQKMSSEIINADPQLSDPKNEVFRHMVLKLIERGAE